MTDRSDIELIRDGQSGSGWLLRIGGTDQSHVELADPLWLEFDYIAKTAMILDTVLVPGAPARVIHIGGAGMTLARYIAASRPRSPQIVLEPDERVTDVVRRNLPLPARSGIRVRSAGGEEGIAGMPDDYADAIIIDAYAGGQVPPGLGAVEFFASTARVLRHDGIVIGNYPDDGPHHYLRRVIAGVSTNWPHVAMGGEPAVIKGRRFGNVLVMASASAIPVDDLARQCASAPLPYRIRTVSGVSSEPFHGEDRRPSPGPPGMFP